MPDIWPAKPESAPLLDDLPSTTDLLNFGEFVSAFQAIIRNKQTKTPFIIGIFGRWGTGKTTLMKMLEKRVEAHGATTIWFSAWQYNNEEHIWAAFLQSLTTRLSEKLGRAEMVRFSAGLLRYGIATDRLLYRGPDLAARVIVVAAPILAASLLSSQLGELIGKVLSAVAGALLSSIVLVGGFLRPTLDAVKANVKPDFSLYRSMDFEEHIGFLDRFHEQFGRIVKALPPDKSQVVVFVDDLDRCSSEKTLQLLDAIKVFLDVKGCVFVLGVDHDIIERSLAQKYPDDKVAQREYINKIVQLPFTLPPLTDRDVRQYLKGLEVAFPDDRCRQVFLSSLSRNPRELKRVINSFTLHWHLAIARTLRDQNEVTPVRLAKVIVIHHAYPGLYALLRDKPELLGRLERDYRGKRGEVVESPDSAGDAAMTSQIGPSGDPLPPALSPFAQETALAKLLTDHALVPGEDASFALLRADQIQIYFTLTRGSTTAVEIGGASSEQAQRESTVDGMPYFSDRYTLLRSLGSGGTSQLFLAKDTRTGRHVVIKRLLETLATDRSWNARFQREMAFLSSLSHPTLVEVLEVGVGNEPNGMTGPFIVMEYVDGESLRSILSNQGPMRPEKAVTTLAPLFDGLAFIHNRAIIHRDIKPSNILIDGSGRAKLSDFGIAMQGMQERDDPITAEGVVVGTPAYMSPEQATNLPVDARSDLFSLGVVLYESMTGKNPILRSSPMATIAALVQGEIEPASSVDKQIPKALDRFLLKLLAVDPKDRYQTALEAKAALLDAVKKQQMQLRRS